MTNSNIWEYTDIDQKDNLSYLSVACTTRCNLNCVYCSKKNRTVCEKCYKDSCTFLSGLYVTLSWKWTPEYVHSGIKYHFGKTLSGEKPIITGEGTQSRDFIYDKDAVNAWLDLGEIVDRGYGQSFNECTGKDNTLNDLINKIIELSGKEVSPDYVGERLCEVKRLIGDNTKLQNIIEFNPVSIETGLVETIEWTKSNLEFYFPSLMGPTPEFMEKYYIGAR